MNRRDHRSDATPSVEAPREIVFGVRIPRRGLVVVSHRHAAQIVHQRPIERVGPDHRRSEEHTSELQSLMRISYAVFCLKKKLIQRILLQYTNNQHIYISYSNTYC